MKKLVALAMILAVAAPSMAATTISVVQPVASITSFNVNYTFDSVGSAPRAFALDVTTNLGTFTAVVAAKTGESTSGSKGYGIFPGTIQIDSTGSVTNIGSPVAQHSDLTSGTLGDLPTTGMTLELGSLYATTDAKPATSGTLVTVTMSGIAAGQTAIVTVVPNTARGGVVLEDATSLAAFTATGTVTGPVLDCFASSLTTYAAWTQSGKPACWCPPTSATGLPVGGTGYQCAGDAYGDTGGSSYRVYTNDLNTVMGAWKAKFTDSSWTTAKACADVDHKSGGSSYRVYTGDLNRVMAYWKAKDNTLKTIFGTVGGVQQYCGMAGMPTAAPGTAVVSPTNDLR